MEDSCLKLWLNSVPCPQNLELGAVKCFFFFFFPYMVCCFKDQAGLLGYHNDFIGT